MKIQACALALLLATAVPAAADPLPSTIRIGVINDMSGPYAAADGVGAVTAARLAVEDFGGKVLGRPVEIVPGDNQTKPDLAVSIVRRWVDDGIAAVVDGGSSAASLAALTILKDNDRPFLFTSQSTMAFTNEACSPVSVHFTYDAYSLGKSLVDAMMSPKTESWYFITANYAGGMAVEDSMSGFIKAAGGKVVGSSRHPIGDADFSSFLLQARSSGAKVIVAANFVQDLVNTLKQAGEFGVGRASSQQFAIPLIFLGDIKAIGPSIPPFATGMSFYWDMSDKTRAFAKRFADRMGGQYPEEPHAGAYSAVLHYLKALQAAGTLSGAAVVAKMKEIPVNDFWNSDVAIRADGRVMHPFHLAELKAPGEPKEPYDYLKLVRTIAPDDAFQPLAMSRCPLVKKAP